MLKAVSITIAMVNIIGIICLLYFAVPYITHDTTVKNPDAMLPVEAWDSAGMTLTIGLVPLIIANVLGFIYVKFQKKYMRLLWFIPSAICFVLVASYWLVSIIK